MPSDARLIRDWLKSSLPLSENTLKQYHREAERFSAWLLEDAKCLLTCDADDLKEYFAVLQKPPSDEQSAFHTRRRKALTKSSLCQTQRILRLMLSWVTQEGHRACNPFWKIESHPRAARSTYSPITKSTQPRGSLFQAVAKKTCIDESEESLRARVIAHLAFWSGAASSEISNLKLGDVRKIEGNFFLQLPGQEHPMCEYVALPVITGLAIEAYTAIRRKRGESTDDDAPLIGSLRGGQKVSGWTIWRAVRYWDALEDGPLATSPQQLRRAFQEAAVQGGAQECVVAKHLRRQRLPQLVVSPIQVNIKQLQKIVRRELKNEITQALPVSYV